MIQISDKEYNKLSWRDIDGARVDTLFTGSRVVGAEPTDYPDTDAITLYLEDAKGNITALEIGADRYTLDPVDNPFYMRITEIKREGATA